VDCFLARRQKSAEILQQAIESLPDGEKQLPRLVLGAEVAWRSDLLECERLNELCIGSTSNLLLELPFKPWNNLMIDQLYELIGRTGVRPVIAHLDRYLGLQSSGLLNEIMNLGVPVQVGTDILMQPLRRRKALKLLKSSRRMPLNSLLMKSLKRQRLFTLTLWSRMRLLKLKKSPQR
jgi:protein-tyrosine phosphatase